MAVELVYGYADAMQIPAVCPTCLTVFSSGISANNVRGLTLSGNRAGPCPGCGGMGDVINGTFDVVNDTIRALNDLSRRELERVARILHEEKNPERIIERIEKEAPAAAGLAKFIPQNPKDLAAYLTVLVAIVAMLLAQSRANDPPSEVVHNVNIEIDLDGLTEDIESVADR